MGHFTGHLESMHRIGFSPAFPWGKLPLYRVTNSADPLTYWWNADYAVPLPAAFESDGASVPWPFNRGLPPCGGSQTDEQWLRAALIHDWLYQRQGYCAYDIIGQNLYNEYRKIRLPRKECDEIFHSAMLDSGVNKSKALVMYKAVDLLGQGPWDKHKKGQA